MASVVGGAPPPRQNYSGVPNPNAPNKDGYTPAQVAKNLATPASQVEKSPYYMDQKKGMDLQFGPNGGYYVPSLPGNQTNPWSAMGGQDQMAQATGTAQANQNISTLKGQQGQYAGDANAYPAMANSYGIGNTTGAVPGQAAGPGYAQQPLNITMPDSGSRGFNPWSLQGESNARGG